MNYRLIVRQLGLLLIVLSTLLAVIGMWSLAEWRLADHAEEGPATRALLVTALMGGLAGLMSWLGTRKAPDLFSRREALLLVAASWFVGAALAALPYFLWAELSEVPSDHPFMSFINCYFESMSGLTTTGATVLGDIESVPPSLLLWRSMTHWLGGLGIVVLFVAVLPSLGVRGKRLFKVEAPGPEPEGVRPHAYDTARVLWLLYLGLTIAGVLALRATGDMGWFDSICHTFSAVSTGGLSTRDASIAAFDSVAVELVLCGLMLLAGVNFALFYQMTRGRYRQIWRDPELRFYLVLKVVGIAIITLNILHVPIETTAGLRYDPSAVESLRAGTFVSMSMQTGTGFCTADYDPWPVLSRVLIIGLIFIGGCAGSTAGGVKVIRVWITIKVLFAELERAFRPNVVRPLKLGETTIDADMKLGALAYVLTLFFLFGIGSFLITLCEPAGSRCDFLTATTASLSTICNVGPGLREVGATHNYGWFTDGSKVVMTLLMALGRLEVFAILVLFTPRFWQGR